MTKTASQAGFSAVELLISMFIAVAFIGAGYQLYAVIIKDGSEARLRTRASNIAYTNLRLHATNTTNPCTTSTSSDSLPSSAELPNANMTVGITCPFGGSDSVSRVAVSVSYGSPQQEVVHALYVTN